jgi:hypothetical protein
MAKKEKAADRSIAKKQLKPVKKVRSFNIDDRIYNGLMELLEESGTQITLSVLVDEFLRKLYVYLLEADGVLKKAGADILSSVIYDCMNIEYFRESNKKNTRIYNLIYSHQASKAGMSLSEWLAELPPEAFNE